MKRVLAKYGVNFPLELEAKFESSFKLHTVGTELKYRPNCNVSLNDIFTIYNEFSEFLLPIVDSLDTLVFKTQRGCVIIDSCIDYYLKRNANSDCMPLPSLNKSTTVLLTSLNSAVQNAEHLLDMILDGDATVKQILDVFTLPALHEAITAETVFHGKPIFNQVLHFSTLPAIKKLDLEEESVSLQAFVYLKTSSHRCLHVSESITAIIDIFEACDEIANLNRMCEQFDLTVCLNDPPMKHLCNITDEFHSDILRARITMNEAIEKMLAVEEILKIRNLPNNPCFKLISELQKCGSLYYFAQEKGFTSTDDIRNSLFPPGLVTASLHKDILDQLCGAMEFIFPFFDKQCSLSELMTTITTLSNDITGISQLRIVMSNIDLIKLCFKRVEVINLILQKPIYWSSI